MRMKLFMAIIKISFSQLIIFVDFQQQGERGLTNAPDEDPDDLSTGYYGSAYRSPENWTTALRSSHFSAAARRGIISDRFVEAILRLSHFHKE